MCGILPLAGPHCNLAGLHCDRRDLRQYLVLPNQFTRTIPQSWKTNVASLSTCKSLSCCNSARIKLTFSNSYVPRKCSATNRIIKAKDHASVQISVGKVDENGRYTGDNQVYALCGFVRAMGESDDAFSRLAQRDGFVKSVWSASR